MAESQTVATLTAKRDEIASTIIAYEKRLATARADLAHIKAALEIFAAGDDPATHRTYVNLFKLFRYGEMAKLCRDALADGPLTSAQVAARVMALKGMDATDKELARSVAFSVLHSMRGMKNRRIVDRTKVRNRCVWRLTSADGAANSLSTDGSRALALPLARSGQTGSRSRPADGSRATPFLTHRPKDTLS